MAQSSAKWFVNRLVGQGIPACIALFSGIARRTKYCSKQSAGSTKPPAFARSLSYKRPPPSRGRLFSPTQPPQMASYLLVPFPTSPLCGRPNIAQGKIVWQTIVDATTSGNVSRFFNHSCEPTLSVFVVSRRRCCFFLLHRLTAGIESVERVQTLSSSGKPS